MKRFKKDKTSVALSDNDKTSTLPPPRSAATYPPQEFKRRVSSSGEDAERKSVESSLTQASNEYVDMGAGQHAAGLHTIKHEEDSTSKNEVNKSGMHDDAFKESTSSLEDEKNGYYENQVDDAGSSDVVIDQADRVSTPIAAPRHFAAAEEEIQDQEEEFDVISQDSMVAAAKILDEPAVVSEDDLKEDHEAVVVEDAPPSVIHQSQGDINKNLDEHFVLSSSKVKEHVGSSEDHNDLNSLTHIQKEEEQSPDVWKDEVSSRADESEISSYHSSQIGSRPSSVSVSDEVASVSEFPSLPPDKIMSQAVAPETAQLHSNLGENFQADNSEYLYERASDVLDKATVPEAEKKLTPTDQSALEDMQIRSSHPVQGSSGAEEENVYLSLDEPKPAKPSETDDDIVDDYEDSVYDTIIVVSDADCVIADSTENEKPSG